MLELHVADVDVTSGSIPISWCVDQETLADLAKYDANDPQVVLVIVPEDVNYHPLKEMRYVFPLKDLMGYVEFKYPGRNKVWAFISTHNKSYAKNRYLERTRSVYNSDILNYEGTGWAYRFINSKNENKPEFAAEPLELMVPKEVFAPEPAEWEKTWVNLFFKDKCVDQCHFRKRRMFAYTVQPFIMILNLFLRFIITLIALLVGARGFTLTYLLHPIYYDLADTMDIMEKGSIFVNKTSYEEDYDMNFFGLIKKCWKMIFMPLIMIPLAYFIYKAPLMITLVVGASFLIAFLILSVVSLAMTGKLSGLIDMVLDLFISSDSKNTKDLWYLDQKEMELLVCNGQKKPTKVSELPAKRRSVKLRFQDLKSRVCRPFAG